LPSEVVWLTSLSIHYILVTFVTMINKSEHSCSVDFIFTAIDVKERERERECMVSNFGERPKNSPFGFFLQPFVN
jgi:hypothetical protein